MEVGQYCVLYDIFNETQIDRTAIKLNNSTAFTTVYMWGSPLGFWIQGW